MASKFGLHEAALTLIKAVTLDVPDQRALLAANPTWVAALVRAGTSSLQRPQTSSQALFGGVGVTLATLSILARWAGWVGEVGAGWVGAVG